MGAALLVVALRGAREQACDIIWRARVIYSCMPWFSLGLLVTAPLAFCGDRALVNCEHRSE